MKALRIDFARPGWRQVLYRATPLAWLLLALGLALCLVAGVLGLRLMHQKEANAQALAAALVRAKAPLSVPVAAPANAISEQQAGAVNAAVLQLNLPWRALHDAVGSATPASIALLALEPDARKRSLRITAEAKSSDEMIAYVEQLKRQELFEGVALLRHEINEQDPNRPIRFQLNAEWSTL